jgi:hypothetical protein
MTAEPTPTAPTYAESRKGPFTSTEVKTFKISGPIEITLTTTYNSSHVPPPPSGGESRSLFAALQPIAEMILSKLDEIRAAQQPDDAQH